jgi:hypothetical protein
MGELPQDVLSAELANPPEYFTHAGRQLEVRPAVQS